MNESVQHIEIAKLKPHPKNPRISVREDVVAAIAANIKEGFDPAHALIVRPNGEEFEIISGHHRAEAAKKAKLETVPCWVREMDDDEAYMALVTSNSQGELSPLEIGMHALGLDLDKRGKGASGGGLKGYAESVGRSASKISEYRQAAKVAASINSPEGINDLSDKAKHLSAIHALPEACWPEAVEAMVKGQWSAKETAQRVKESGAESVKRSIALLTNKTTRRELARIDELKANVTDSLNYDDLRQQWTEWLDENDPVDVKEVQAKRIDLESIDYDRRAAEREKQEDEAPKLPQLILADPPWRYDFAQSDSRQIENQYPSATVDEIIGHRPDTEPDCVLFLWATVAKLPEALEVMRGWGFEYKTHAVWDKQKIGMGYWFRGQHELLLVGTKGKVSPPNEGNRPSSLFSEPRSKHSAKPECIYKWLESAFSSLEKKEMYCRNQREGWQAEGNESGT